MRTEDLIRTIALDAGAAPKRLRPAMAVALALSAGAAWLAATSMLAPRPAVDPSFAAVRYPLKFVLTGAFAAAAAAMSLRLARPGARLAAPGMMLLAAAALFAIAVIAELYVTPSGLWRARVVGQNALACLTRVPLISAAPLAALLLALRRGAPGSPTALGAAAGLLAGAVGATFSAAHCPDDSPLFLAVWYVLAVGFVTAIGAAIGSRALRW